MRYGAFSLQAIARILAARGRPKTPLDALADESAGLSDRPWLDENPTSATTHLRLSSPVGRGAPRCRTDRPRHAEPSRPSRNQPGESNGATAACMTTSPRRCERWASRWLPEALDAALSAAEKESLSHLQFLHRLLAGPAEAKLQRALERRIRAAKFRELTTLEGFDWEFNAKGVDRRSIEQLATCDFVRRHENVILVGQSGLGKSRILQAVGHAACVLGYRVRYATSSKLLQEFTAALADGTLDRKLNEYARFDLLLIDEFGFDRLEREVECPGQHRSTIACSTPARAGVRRHWRPTSTSAAWADYLGDPPLATAFLDRLVDGAVILKLTGRSYRAHRARPAPETGQAD